MDPVDPHGSQDGPAPTVGLHLLGPPRWRSGAERSGSLTCKDAALLALLAVGGPRTRESLAGTLWPSKSQAAAHTNLRQRLMRLRDSIAPWLFDDGPLFRLSDDVRVDVRDIGALPTDELLALGELLAGCDFDDNEALDAWVRQQREACRHSRADLLERRSIEAERSNRLTLALALNRASLELLPLRESAWRRQMELHYLNADHAAAIEAFEGLEQMLRNERGGHPSPETLELLQTIESAQQAPRMRRGSVPACLRVPPVLVGRERERDEMSNAWDEGRAFVVWADAGLGKTRLLAEHVRHRSGTVLEHGLLGDAQTPYALLARLLRTVLARHPPTRPLDDFARRELARIVPDLGPAAPAPAQQAILWHAIEQGLAAAVAAGLEALVVDDLHLADIASLETLRWLAGHGGLTGLRFGFATRPMDAGPVGEVWREWLGASQRPVWIVLQALSAEDVATLLGTLALPEFSSSDLAPQLFRHAGGHPMFTLETLKARLLDAPGTGDELPRPASVQQQLDQRLATLSSAALDLMRVAAVCGEDLTGERAADLLGRKLLDLSGPWQELEAAHVLVDLRFAHDLVRDSALRLTPKAVRRPLHRALARLLAADGDAAQGRVAAHWEAAEQWAEAAAAWRVAGIGARYAGRMDEHGALLERAADCFRRAGDVAGEFDARLPAIDSLMLREGTAAVLDELTRLDEIACTPDRQLQVILVRIHACVVGDRVADALALSRTALAMAPAFPALHADASCLRGMALAQSGAVDEAIAVLGEAVELARRAGDQSQMLRAASGLAGAYGQTGRYADAVAMQRDSLALARDIGDASQVALCEANLATCLGMAGDPYGCYRHAVQARDGYRAMGPLGTGLYGSLNLIDVGCGAAYFGRFDEALEALQASLRIFGDQTNRNPVAKVRMALADLWSRLGRNDEARAVMSAVQTPLSPLWHALVHLKRAQLDGANGRPVAPHLEQVRSLLDANPGLDEQSSLWADWSRYGDPVPVVQALRRVRARCERLGQLGPARMLALREIARCLEPAAEACRPAAAALVAQLIPLVENGLHVSAYPPEAWLVLALACDQQGRAEAAQQCRSTAVRWIRERALPNVPADYRASFLEGNPVNRILLATAD